MTLQIIDSKSDNSLNPFFKKKKKVRYKKNKQKNLNILFNGEHKKYIKQIINWPKNLPKNCKIKGKNYIHDAADKCDIRMLNRAIKENHDLTRHDSFGKNALYYLFNNESLDLINIDFFKNILSANKEAWKPINTYDFLNYFANKVSSIKKYKQKDVYNKDKYEEIMILYRNFIKLIQEYNLEFNLISKHFYKIKFNTTIQGEIIEDALLASYNKEKCLINLIERVNFFSTPIIDNNEIEEKVSFLTILDDFGYYSSANIGHALMMGRTKIGKSYFLPIEMLGLEISQYADQNILHNMWKNHILKYKQFNELVCSDKLFTLMQKYNHILASNIMKDNLEKELISVGIQKETKKMKI